MQIIRFIRLQYCFLYWFHFLADHVSTLLSPWWCSFWSMPKFQSWTLLFLASTLILSEVTFKYFSTSHSIATPTLPSNGYLFASNNVEEYCMGWVCFGSFTDSLDFSINYNNDFFCSLSPKLDLKRKRGSNRLDHFSSLYVSHSIDFGNIFIFQFFF